MSDLPADRKIKNKVVAPEPRNLEVTHENADLLTVHFLSQILSRLGYLIKLIEEKK